MGIIKMRFVLVFLILIGCKNIETVKYYRADGTLERTEEKKLSDSAKHSGNEASVAIEAMRLRKAFADVRINRENKESEIMMALFAEKKEKKLAASVKFPRAGGLPVFDADPDKGVFQAPAIAISSSFISPDIELYQPDPDMFVIYTMLRSLRNNKSFNFRIPKLSPMKPHPVWNFAEKATSGISSLAKWGIGGLVLGKAFESAGDNISGSHNSSFNTATDSHDNNSNFSPDYSHITRDSGNTDSHDNNSSFSPDYSSITRDSGNTDSHDNNSSSSPDYSSITRDSGNYDLNLEDNSTRTFDWQYSRPITIDWQEYSYGE